jgi:hypothetical protein
MEGKPLAEGSTAHLAYDWQSMDLPIELPVGGPYQAPNESSHSRNGRHTYLVRQFRMSGKMFSPSPTLPRGGAPVLKSPYRRTSVHDEDMIISLVTTSK